MEVKRRETVLEKGDEYCIPRNPSNERFEARERESRELDACSVPFCPRAFRPSGG
jgi:hypothetical protein